MKSIRLITPAECTTKIGGFILRMKRLDENQYTNPRFRTMDLNKLFFEVRRMSTWASIAVFNKNKDRALTIINEAETLMNRARVLVENHYHGK